MLEYYKCSGQPILRFIYKDYESSYESLLLQSKMPSLKLRRMRTMALVAFKIIYKETPLYLQNIITMKNNSYSFRYSNLTDIPQVRTTNYGLNSFRLRAAKLWNSLPDSFRQISYFNQFKSQINCWEGIPVNAVLVPNHSYHCYYYSFWLILDRYM